MVFGMNYTNNVASTMKMVAATAAIIPITLTLSITRGHAGKNVWPEQQESYVAALHARC